MLSRSFKMFPNANTLCQSVGNLSRRIAPRITSRHRHSLKNLIQIRTAAFKGNMCEEKANNFCLSDYDVIGFDLDCTLLRYNLNNTIPLIYASVRDYLIDHVGYPINIFKKPFDHDFIQRGLIMDIERGNILKLNRESVIIKGAHGTTFLTDDDLKKIYGKDKIWCIAEMFQKDPLVTWNGDLAEKIRSVLDYFDICIPYIFAKLVDYMDTKVPQPKTYTENWSHILSALTFIFDRHGFANNSSPFFNQIKNQTHLYLTKTPRSILRTIIDLQNQGKIVYLLTGSDIDYANFTASYAISESWKSLFDCIIAFAKKPGFFIQHRQFYEVENNVCLPNRVIELDKELELENSCYCGGNWDQLSTTFAKKLNKPVDELKCVHIGDNIIQDIYTPNHYLNMATVAVCEELKEDQTNYIYGDIIRSDAWGSYFKVNNEETLFSAMLRNYSGLVIPTVSDLCQQSLDEFKDWQSLGLKNKSFKVKETIN